MSVEALIKEASDKGVKLYMVGERLKYEGAREAVNDLLVPLRQHKAELIHWFTQTSASDPEPLLDQSTWRELAEAYHVHHFKCQTCIAAGRGARYGQRCGVGIALWNEYTDKTEHTAPTPHIESQHRQREN